MSCASVLSAKWNSCLPLQDLRWTSRESATSALLWLYRQRGKTWSFSILSSFVCNVPQQQQQQQKKKKKKDPCSLSLSLLRVMLWELPRIPSFSSFFYSGVMLLLAKCVLRNEGPTIFWVPPPMLTYTYIHTYIYKHVFIHHHHSYLNSSTNLLYLPLFQYLYIIDRSVELPSAMEWRHINSLSLEVFTLLLLPS